MQMPDLPGTISELDLAHIQSPPTIKDGEEDGEEDGEDGEEEYEGEDGEEEYDGEEEEYDGEEEEYDGEEDGEDGEKEYDGEEDGEDGGDADAKVFGDDDAAAPPEKGENLFSRDIIDDFLNDSNDNSIFI